MQKLSNTEVVNLPRHELEANFLELQDAFELALRHISELSPHPKRPRGRPKNEPIRGLVKMLLEDRHKTNNKRGRPPKVKPKILDSLYTLAALIIQKEMIKPHANQRYGLTQATEVLVRDYGDLCRMALSLDEKQPIRDSRLRKALASALKEHRRKVNDYELSSDGK